MPCPDMPALFKPNKFRAFDLACGVQRTGLSAIFVVTRTNDERRRTDFVQRSGPQTFA